VLPKGWESRLFAVNNDNARGVTGYCIDAHDLAISKLVAQRPKDVEFVQEMVRHDMIEKKTMLRRVEQTELQEPIRRNIQMRIKSLFRV
jgi:hypothetical protein